MALDPVPWFIGGGARHSAASARNLAWNATGGKTGISTPTSLEVRAMSTASNSVQIMPGGAVVESIYQGALQQSYTVRNASATSVAIPANTTSSTRTYYVTAEINDPTYAGSNPPSKEEGPYNYFRVRTSRQSIHPEVLLAKVKARPNSPILSSDITDMRKLANPRREEYVFGRPRVTADDYAANLNQRVATGGEFFPGNYSSGSTASPNVFELTVPEWATRVMIDASWMSVRYTTNTNPYGSYWVEFGDEYRGWGWPDNQQFEFNTQRFSFNSPGRSNDTSRTNWLLMDALPIAKKLRGKDIELAFKAGYHANSEKGVAMDAAGGLGCRVTFVEVPESVDIV